MFKGSSARGGVGAGTDWVGLIFIFYFFYSSTNMGQADRQILEQKLVVFVQISECVAAGWTNISE